MKLLEMDRDKLRATKKIFGRVHTQVSELVEDIKDPEDGIFMLVNHKAKQNKKVYPARIYLDN